MFILSLFLTFSFVAGTELPAAASPVSNPCRVTRHDGLSLAITTPKRNATINLSKTPLITVAGLIHGARNGTVSSVRLYADGKPVGYAKLAKASRLAPARPWKIATSAAPGTHTVVACARTSRGVTASATITVKVVKPAASATVTAPDVVTLPAATTNAITRVTSSALTFKTPPALTVGQVLTAGVTAHTPQGLMRRITAIRTTSGGTVVSTVPAHLDEVFWQADLHLRDAALTPAGAAGLRASAVKLPIPTIKLPFDLKAGTPGTTVSGNVAVSGEAEVKLEAELDVDVKISTHWSWSSLPTITLDEFRFAAHGTAEDTFSAADTGTGKLSFTKDNVLPPISLAPVTFSVVPPIVITPKIEIDGKADFSLGGSLKIEAKQTAEITAGFDYVGGKMHSLDDTKITPGESGVTADATATGTASFYLQPDIAGYVDELIGPDAGLQLGVKVTGTVSCPVDIKAKAFVKVTAGGEINLFVKKISYSDAGLELDQDLWDGSFGCGGSTPPPTGTPLTISTTRLPDAQVGTPYASNLNATGGTGTPTWSLAGGSLPDGLTLSADGKISGQASAETTANVTVKATDASGAGVTAALTLTVDAKLPDPVAVTAPPAFDPLPACAGACGSTWGDPHLITYDGAHYDFQQVGEFVATKSSTTDLQMQVRQQPYNGSRTIAINTAVAFEVAGHRVGVYLTGTGTKTLVDGSTVTPTATGTALPGGGSLSGDSDRVTVRWPDGSLVTVDLNGGSYLTLSLNLASAQRGHLTGLLGDADGSPDNDMTTRSGVVATQPYGDFASGWRVSPSESLFDYGTGESTTTFTDTNFPYATVTSSDLPAANRDAALAVCRAAGIPDGPVLDACVLDVAVTGDVSAATAAATAQSNAAATVIAASAAGDAWTDEHGTTGTAALTYGHLGCVSLDASSSCTGGAWAVVPRAPWIWTSQFSTDNQYTVTFTKTVQITAAQAAAPQTLTALADDNVVASVDGTQVLSTGYNSPATATLNLTAGPHTLTFVVTNMPVYDPQGNPGGLAWKLTTS